MTPTTAPTTPTTPTSSEESGYNEADSENLSAPPTDVIRMGARTFRRPSVVVSDYDNSVNDNL